MNDIKLAGVPTYIITGFLGAGKTTLITELLKQKPENEKWAVLVNEFGEVGIDGALIEGAASGQVSIREVPGGCMCCTAGLPMQVALTQLLSSAMPDRLLIEPSGLGHPKEVLATLSQEYFQDVLDVRATFTLIDARKLSDERYLNHATFNQQIEIANHIVATKSDLYSDHDFTQIEAYLESKGRGDLPIDHVVQGKLDFAIFDQCRSDSAFSSDHHGKHSEHHSHHVHTLLDIEAELKQRPHLTVSNSGDGYYSQGWAFDLDKQFDYEKVLQVLSECSVERLKAVLKTEQGFYAFNRTEDSISYYPSADRLDSRLELITANQQQAEQLKQQLEQSLLLPE